MLPTAELDLAMDMTVTAAQAVALVALAIDRLGPATLRTISTGRQVQVEVPDLYTAEIFRAALARTATRRPTDSLVKVASSAAG
jgi:hypothetical protein